MAVKKSTLNKNLPVVTKISWCTEPGVNMSTSITTGELHDIVRKWCFKQTSKAYPYQIQFRHRSRYTLENEKIKGARWTAWSEWENYIAVDGVPGGAKESVKPVDTWLKANAGVNTKGTYKGCCTFTTYRIPDMYDARQFQLRVRTFNKSQAKHGNWASQTLTAYCKAWCKTEKIITSPDGGGKVKFNYKWDRECHISVESIKDSQGREILKQKYDTSVNEIELSDTTFPQAVEGFRGGKFVIPLKMLKRKLVVGELLTPKFFFVTSDGAKTGMECRLVYEPRRDISMDINYSWEEERGLLTVNATNTDSVAIQDVGCSISYEYNGKRYTIAPFDKNIALDGTSQFYFLPPIGKELTINVSAEDANDVKGTQEVTGVVVNAKGYRLNSLSDPTVCALAWGEPQFQINSAVVNETALPYGRTRNVIFYGKGTATDINFSATIVDEAGMYGGDYARKRAWDKLRNNQGLYWFRTNNGDMYKVGVTAVNTSHDWKTLYELEVDMVEVE